MEFIRTIKVLSGSKLKIELPTKLRNDEGNLCDVLWLKDNGNGVGIDEIDGPGTYTAYLYPFNTDDYSN